MHKKHKNTIRKKKFFRFVNFKEFQILIKQKKMHKFAHIRIYGLVRDTTHTWRFEFIIIVIAWRCPALFSRLKKQEKFKVSARASDWFGCFYAPSRVLKTAFSNRYSKMISYTFILCIIFDRFKIKPPSHSRAANKPNLDLRSKNKY